MHLNWLRSTLAFTEREYFLSGVNMLTNRLNRFFRADFLSDWTKNMTKYCRGVLSSVSDPLTCWPFISVLKRSFLDIWITPVFSVYNLRNRLPKRIIYFFIVFQILWRFWKCRNKLRKFFLIWRELTWIGCTKHSLLLRENTFYQVLIC